MAIMTDEETEKLIEIYDRVHTLAILMGIHPSLDRFVDASGEPLGTTELDAIQQAIVRDWETVRIRDEIWHSKLDRSDQDYLILLLNLVETHAHSFIKEEKTSVILREFNTIKDVINERQQRIRDKSSSNAA